MHFTILNEYNIILNENLIEKVSEFICFEKYSKIILLTDDKVYALWCKTISKFFPQRINLVKIKNGETSKNFQNAFKIISKMIDFKIDRKSLLINFGGGMVSDIGGFVASIYMRGIDCINIPTSLLAMVDASIGGKTAINIGNFKNIIGSFSNPKLVLMDINFLKTLDRKEKKSAMAEIIKHAIIYDKAYFDYLDRQTDVDDIDNNKALMHIISESLRIKKDIVEKDFKEQNLRKIVNFGHTIGHAFEALSLASDTNILLHGEAVAIGMLLEAQIASKMNILPEEDFMKIKKILLKYFYDVLTRSYNFEISDLLTKIKLDKKNEGDKIKFALPQSIGVCGYDILVEEAIIKIICQSFLLKDKK